MQENKSIIMSIQNKRFQNNNDSSDVVAIVGDNGVFYNLSNGANIKKDIFFQRYSEMVDPSSFFEQQSRAGLESLAGELTEKLKTVDSSKIVGGDIPPRVRYVEETMSEQLQAPAEYRDMLLKRFEYEQSHKDMSQYKVYDDDEAAAADFEKKLKQQQPQPPQRQRPRPPEEQQWMGSSQSTYQPPMEPIIESSTSPMPTTSSPYISPEEEAFRFFRSFKRIYPIKLSVDFDEKIAEPGFIKMMAMNYEGDIIKFYTKEFMNRIYNDPGFLENKIYEKLKSLVFEEHAEKPKSTRKPKTLVEGSEKNNNQKTIKTPKPDKKPKPMING